MSRCLYAAWEHLAGSKLSQANVILPSIDENNGLLTVSCLSGSSLKQLTEA